MSKRISILATVLLILSAAVVVAAQTTVTTTPTTVVTQTPTTVTKTVQNPDGTYTVIEYPVGKEVQLTLNPITLTNSKAVATILRDDNGTRIALNVTGLPANLAAMNLYTVDDTGAVSSLGPVVLSNGTGKFSGTTPLSKFMLITAADDSLTTYDPNTKIFFRSAVPQGFAIIPHTVSPTGETVAATATPATTTTSVVTAPVVTEPVVTAPVVTAPVVTAPVVTTPVVTTPVVTVPMLNIPAYKKGDDTKIKVDFTGAMAGARANVFIEPHKSGQETEVRMRFHDLKAAPTGQTYVLWAISPDNQFFKLGQVTNFNAKNEAEIKANTSLADFGLLVTMEDVGAFNTIVVPAGPRLGVIQIVP